LFEHNFFAIPVSSPTFAGPCFCGPCSRGNGCRLVSPRPSPSISGGTAWSMMRKPAPPPATFIQSTLRAWEDAALSAASGASKVTIICFGTVCAPDGYPGKLARLFRRGFGFIAGDGEQIVHCRYRGCRRHDALGGGTGAWTASQLGLAAPPAFPRCRGSWDTRSGCGFPTGSPA
jgi:hypothetical protein